MVFQKARELMELCATKAPLKVEEGGGTGGIHRASRLGDGSSSL